MGCFTRLELVTRNVFVLPLLPKYAVNVYLADQLLIDAATRYHTPLILQALRNHHVVAHLLTHVHPDHQGASSAVCTTLGIPLWCSTHDAPAMESGDMQTQFPALQPAWVTTLLQHQVAGPAYPVTRRLQEGDRIGDWVVLETPGHTRGHLSFWRQDDRVLILGDLVSNTSLHSRTGWLHRSPPFWTVDDALNRQSARKVAALNPAIICFGHGPPLYDGAPFVDYVAQLT